MAIIFVMKLIKSIALVSILLSSVSASYAYEVEFPGSSREVISIDGDKKTGLDRIYVVYDISDVSDIEIKGCGSTATLVEKYSNLGGGFAMEVPVSFSDGVVTLNGVEGNMGYIVSDGDSRFCFWIVDYHSFPFSLNSVRVSPEQECDNTSLDVVGNGGSIYYYSIDGRQLVLSREIEIQYNNLEWDEEASNFVSKENIKRLDHISGLIQLTPPLYCNTDVTVTGDRFLKYWGIPISVSTGVIQGNGVDVRSRAEQTNSPSEDDETGSNMIRVETEGLGGSAPADITFYGYITDGVLHTEWQMASDSEFEYILYRFNEQDVSYSFTQEGQYYMRFIGSNADGSCESIGETFTIGIGASDLRIPNAFSPNGDGVNDEWKVGYRSLLDFKCWIFDSRGTQLFHFTDPSKGWDGKYKGKNVAPGVYYYVIEARGADGKKYKKGGDINIVNFKKRGTSSSGDYTE